MRKLTKAEARATMALVRERDEAQAAINEYVAFLGRDMERPMVQQQADGLYLVDAPQPVDKDKP